MPAPERRSRGAHTPLAHLSRRSSADGTSALPADLLKDQVLRVQLFYAVGVFLWTITGAMDGYMAPHGDRGPYRVLIEATAGALAALVAGYARFSRHADQTKVNVGAICAIPMALALALLNSWVEQPTTTRPLSPMTVLILLIGMLAPARPGTMLIVSFVAAAMDPLCVWIAHMRGLPVPSALNAVLLFYPNFVCAVLVVVPARILYRLGREIRTARSLGSYELVERLGEGGMGEVWQARHRFLARSAAIKLIRPDRLGVTGHNHVAVALDRFEREAQATAALTSPHTIRLFDFGLTDEGTFYYAMELLDGRDLESLVRQFGPMPPARAIHILEQVCRSVAEAHALGLIHRDIKPANIYLCRMGLEYDFVKVLDFGLVKHEDGSEAPTMLTAEHGLMGTPAYMAPESVVGTADVDRRVDVYALGCVAYFLLTGEPVFDGETAMKILMQHVQAEPVPPSQRTEQFVPREIDELVLACLKKDPDQRPSSAHEVLRLARQCSTGDAWRPESAQGWWERHLPQFTTMPATKPARPAAGGLVNLQWEVSQ